MDRAAGRSFNLSIVSWLSRGVRRDEIFEHVCEAGRVTGRYVLMSILSAAIATLGLLLSSPAVVIGAMLLSPLMDPIVLLGFSFWTIDWHAARSAIFSLAGGCGLALAVAVILTWASPLKEPTQEILARTRPNLFDLLVAAFSGIAGGYAVIRRRGETFIGVAIATALMPPIATVGFGVGVQDWRITLGALLLFATNLIAIALAAAAMAALYGFRPKLAQGGRLGQALVVVVAGMLCVPLTLSLNTIARESQATAQVRTELRRIFGPKSRLTSLSVHEIGERLTVDVLVATPKYVDDAAGRLRRALGKSVGGSEIDLDQVVLADPGRLEAAPSAPAQPDPTTRTLADLKRAIPFGPASVTYDPGAGKAVVLLDPSSGLDVPTAMKLEQGLKSQPEFTGVQVIPALQALPDVDVRFDQHGAAAFGPAINADLWALQRWRTQQLSVTTCGITAGAHARNAEAALKPLLSQAKLLASRGGRADCETEGSRGPRLLLRPG